MSNTQEEISALIRAIRQRLNGSSVGREKSTTGLSVGISGNWLKSRFFWRAGCIPTMCRRRSGRSIPMASMFVPVSAPIDVWMKRNSLTFFRVSRSYNRQFNGHVYSELDKTLKFFTVVTHIIIVYVL